jgi:hypothetical protein
MLGTQQASPLFRAGASIRDAPEEPETDLAVHWTSD